MLPAAKKLGADGAGALQLLGEQVVSAAASDFALDEFTYRRGLGQDHPRIDIRGIGFSAGNMRLIH